MRVIFRFIQRDIRIAEEIACGNGILWCQGNAHADVDNNLVTTDIKRTVQFLYNPRAKTFNIFTLVKVCGNDDKFVSALACNQINAAHAVAQAVRSFTEHLIAYRMAVDIVNGFKIIQIETDHRQRIFRFVF